MILVFYTLHPVHCHHLNYFTSTSVRKEVAHNEKITLEISLKTLDFFPKNSHVFLFFYYVFLLLTEKIKIDAPRFLRTKSKDDNRALQIAIQTLQSPPKNIFQDYF